MVWYTVTLTERGVSTLHKCPCCHNDCKSIHRHHILPKVLGGVDEESNIIQCCEVCHGKIHGRDMLDHRQLTIEGLRKAKANGVKLGGARPNSQRRHAAVKAKADKKADEMKLILEKHRSRGLSYRKIAEELNNSGVPTERNSKWYASTVRNYYKRLQ